MRDPILITNHAVLYEEPSAIVIDEVMNLPDSPNGWTDLIITAIMPDGKRIALTDKDLNGHDRQVLIASLFDVIVDRETPVDARPLLDEALAACKVEKALSTKIKETAEELLTRWIETRHGHLEKIQTIKDVREYMVKTKGKAFWGLKECKDFVDKISGNASTGSPYWGASTRHHERLGVWLAMAG